MKIGSKVRILSGYRKGKTGTLMSIDTVMGYYYVKIESLPYDSPFGPFVERELEEVNEAASAHEDSNRPDA